MGKRFRKLDLDNSGSLSIDEFMSLPELQQNPLVQRVIDIFDTDRNGEVDFKGATFSISLYLNIYFPVDKFSVFTIVSKISLFSTTPFLMPITNVEPQFSKISIFIKL